MLTRTLTLPAVLAVVLTLAACNGGEDTPAATPSPSPAPSATPAPQADAGSWPMLGHDIASSFRNAQESALSPTNVAQLEEAWSFEAPGNVSGTPAVVDGRVYVLANGGTFAFAAATGELLWENRDVGGTSSPTYDDGTLYVLAGPAVLRALDAETGDELWQAQVDGHPQAAGFSSPVVAGDLVIAGSSSSEEFGSANPTFRGGVVAFDRETGAAVWRHDTVDPPFNGVSVWSSVSVDLEAGAVYATTGNNYTGEASETSDSIFALDLETGELLWNTQLREGDVYTIQNPQSEDSDFGTNPILFEAEVAGETRQLVAAGQKSGDYWALDRTTGEVVWHRKVSGGSALIGGVFNNGAYDGERIIIAGNNGTSDAPGGEPANGESETGLGGATVGTSVLTALDPSDGAVLWERQLPAWVWAPITLAGGAGFVSAESELQAFDTATGEKLFSFKTNGTITSGAAVAGGRVFFGSGLAYFRTTQDQAFYALALP